MTKMGKSTDSVMELQRRAEPAPERTIVLIGLMGAGKTCVGRKLAARVGRPFVDADAEIELAAGCTIAEIFDRLGEAAFRDGERRVMARLLDGKPSVLASGGGAFVDPGTRGLIAEKAVSVWLRADLDLLVKRTAGRDHRPLLKNGDPREALRALMEKRYPIYAEADLTVDTLDQPADATVERVLAALVEHARSGVQAQSGS
jgi:shikimate kinase